MLKDQLNADLKDAMRAKDAVRLRTIRSLRAALMDKEISERQGGEATLTDEQALAVLTKQAKQRRDAMAQYEEADREDLAQKEREELEVIESYLPRQLDDDEIRAELHQLIAATGGAASLKDMGRIMGAAMKQMRGRADGSRVQALVRDLLSN